MGKSWWKPKRAFLSRFLLFFVSLTAIPLNSKAAVGNPPATAGPETVQKVDRYVLQQLERVGLPGAAYGLVVDGKPVLLKSYGVTDLRSREPVTLDTLFEIGSLTKSFTATAILQLRDQGRVDLDAPVQRYLPWFRVKDESASARITVRQLLTHTSGLPTSAENVIWRDESRLRNSMEEAVRALRYIDLRHTPGEQFEYSNMGYVTLGVIVEKVSGQPFGAYVKEHILNVLGMEKTTLDPQSARDESIARPHEWRFLWLHELPLDDYGVFKTPTGRALSSITDMTRYAASQLQDGNASLSARSLQEEHTGIVNEGADTKYAMAWYTHANPEPVVFHDGATEGGSAFLFLLPQSKTGFVILVNTMTLNTIQIGRGVLAILEGKEPADAQRRSEPLRSKGWILLGLLGVALAVLGWLAAEIVGGIRLGIGPRTVWTGLIRPVMFVVLTGLGWGILFFANNQGPLSRSSGIHGWPVDLAVTAGVSLASATLWTLYSIFTWIYWLTADRASG